MVESLLLVDPDWPSALVLRASLHAAQGERVSALACYRRLVRLFPDDPTAAYFLRSLGGADFSAPWRGEIVELFDRYAARFDDHLRDTLEYRGPELLAEALDSVVAPPAAVAVDLGCGTGLGGPMLEARSERLIGVDLSAEMVERARQKAIYDELFVADLVHALLTSDDASVDLLVAADVLGYLGDLEAVFRQARRVLREGARFAFSVECAERVDRFALSSRRRCAYNPDYLLTLGASVGFSLGACRSAVLRREEGEAVEGLVVVFVSPDEALATRAPRGGAGGQ
ncbi:MAG: methyltransferase domain-containing protein [Myxococcales bacterium]|nr:methyltransferase domain-containing protein [Myxococcales bacterium]